MSPVWYACPRAPPSRGHHHCPCGPERSALAMSSSSSLRGRTPGGVGSESRNSLGHESSHPGTVLQAIGSVCCTVVSELGCRRISVYSYGTGFGKPYFLNKAAEVYGAQAQRHLWHTAQPCQSLAPRFAEPAALPSQHIHGSERLRLARRQPAQSLSVSATVSSGDPAVNCA